MGKLICGKHSVLSALEHNLPLKKVFINKSLDINIKSEIKIFIISKREMDKLTKENHQGFIAELTEFNYYTLSDLLKDKPSKILVLDRIQDPNNFGAILRSANAFGIKYVVIAKHRQAELTPAVLKVSSGGYIGIKIVRINSIQNAIKKMKDSGIWIYATTIEKGTILNDVKFNKPMVIIVGNEGKGISKSLLKQSDQNIFIPTTGSIKSLNVSVATGILLSHIQKV